MSAGVNILSKVDRSLAPVPNPKREVTVSKRDKFDWSTGGSCGEFRWIAKNDLNIDSRYQRDQVSDAKVREIARDWDWLLLGCISVIEREDGSLWVFDGGHRARASFFRDDIKELPCMVHRVATVNEEAKAFVARNTMVSNVAAYDRHRASVCAAEPVALSVQAILDEFGLTVIKGGASGAGYLSCIGTLQSCVKEDAEDAKKVLRFLLSIAGERLVVGKVLAAMFTLYRHFKPKFDILEKYGEKISRHSQREIEVKISQFTTECGKGGNVIGAKAILELINHRNRIRVEW
jgi:hypothetical protein